MTDRQLDVLVICGSLRKGSYNAALARSLPALAPPAMTLRAAPSFAGLPIYNFDEHQAGGIPPIAVAWTDAIRSADGVVIVSPEYNWSIPGGLKNAIDWASRLKDKDQPFAGKPVALQAAATGLLGGSRMQYHLRQSLTSIDALMSRKSSGCRRPAAIACWPMAGTSTGGTRWSPATPKPCMRLESRCAGGSRRARRTCRTISSKTGS
jgi:chromate reductase